MILMVTALNELGDIERAGCRRCDDFLSKPVNKLELLKRVENMLKLRHVTDELERLRRYIDSMERPSAAGPTRRVIRLEDWSRGDGAPKKADPSYGGTWQSSHGQFSLTFSGSFKLPSV